MNRHDHVHPNTKVCNLETQPLIWVFNNLENYSESICNVMLTTVDILSYGVGFFQSCRMCRIGKGQLISKGLVGILNSSKKNERKNSTYSTMMFFERIEDTKKSFRN